MGSGPPPLPALPVLVKLLVLDTPLAGLAPGPAPCSLAAAEAEWCRGGFCAAAAEPCFFAAAGRRGGRAALLLGAARQHRGRRRQLPDRPFHLGILHNALCSGKAGEQAAPVVLQCCSWPVYSCRAHGTCPPLQGQAAHVPWQAGQVTFIFCAPPFLLQTVHKWQQQSVCCSPAEARPLACTAGAGRTPPAAPRHARQHT